MTWPRQESHGCFNTRYVACILGVSVSFQGFIRVITSNLGGNYALIFCGIQVTNSSSSSSQHHNSRSHSRCLSFLFLPAILIR